MAAPNTLTPRTDRQAMHVNGIESLVVFASFAEQLELELDEARALLTRISDGAKPVLLAEEIEEFLDRTEMP